MRKLYKKAGAKKTKEAPKMMKKNGGESATKLVKKIKKTNPDSKETFDSATGQISQKALKNPKGVTKRKMKKMSKKKMMGGTDKKMMYKEGGFKEPSFIEPPIKDIFES